MALEDLIARLERDAERRIAAAREKASAEAATLRAEAARRREEVEREELEAHRATASQGHERELARARAKARADRLAAEREVIDRVLGRALELIEEVGRSEGYARAVARQLQRALVFVDGVAVTVRARPELIDALKGVAPVLKADPELGWGVEVVADDGSVRIDETLKARLERLAPRLSVQILEELKA